MLRADRMKHAWLQHFVDAPVVGQLLEAAAPQLRLAAAGAVGSAAHLLAGAAAKRSGRPVLLVTAHLDDADEALDDLDLFDAMDAAVLPALEVMPGESNVSLELLTDRLATVGRLIEDEQPTVLIAPVQALMQAVPTPATLDQLSRRLARGDKLDPAQLIAWLDEGAYTRVDVVSEPGEFAVRGGMVDIVPPGGLDPLRVDFFGDEIDEISQIDLDTMASDRKLEAVRLITAAAEQTLDDHQTTTVWTMLQRETIVVMHEVLEVEEQARGYYERLTDPRGVVAPATVQKALGQFALIEANQYSATGVADRTMTLPIRPLPHFENDAA